MVHQFNRNMLPLLGVTWNRFSTQREAMAFAKWAEKETKNDQYPCEAFVIRDDDLPEEERFEVKVRNW